MALLMGLADQVSSLKGSNRQPRNDSKGDPSSLSLLQLSLEIGEGCVG
jgi:hypothetical protein